ncbi:MAG: lasso peptide biosynthesis B2 protein [Egibacteraceae bacterium]
MTGRTARACGVPHRGSSASCDRSVPVAGRPDPQRAAASPPRRGDRRRRRDPRREHQTGRWRWPPCILDRHLLLCAARRRGVRWCLGVRISPFESHAWIEADGQAVGERADVARTYWPVAEVPLTLERICIPPRGVARRVQTAQYAPSSRLATRRRSHPTCRGTSATGPLAPPWPGKRTVVRLSGQALHSLPRLGARSRGGCYCPRDRTHL